MIVDTSALVAVLLDEPETRSFVRLLTLNPTFISAATLVEARVVMTRGREVLGRRALDTLLREIDVSVVPVDAEQADIASDAYRDFGRGSGHRAHLNYGDCFSYALAIARSDTLLYKGDDFTHTDVRPATDP